jgi:hypothetical protein
VTTTTIPGFTAEAAVYKNASPYRMGRARTVAAAGVMLQQLPKGSFSICLSWQQYCTTVTDCGPTGCHSYEYCHPLCTWRLDISY